MKDEINKLIEPLLGTTIKSSYAKEGGSINQTQVLELNNGERVFMKQNLNPPTDFFLAEIICDLKLDYDNEVNDHCGKCTKCIDACPTDAIREAQVIDANKCISYLTIENKENIPTEFNKKLKDLIFGCDICQDVCPWNRFSQPHNEKQFNPKNELIEFTKKDWKELTKETFDIIFKDSAVKRAKFEGIKRNIFSAS